VPHPGGFPGLTQLSVAGLFAEAISRIHRGRSVSRLFNNVDPSYAPPPQPEGLF
jgi:ribose-phosphate pyrophosphokinase